LIGEAFDSITDVCGAVVNIRNKGDKICKCFPLVFFFKLISRKVRLSFFYFEVKIVFVFCKTQLSPRNFLYVIIFFCKIEKWIYLVFPPDFRNNFQARGKSLIFISNLNFSPLDQKRRQSRSHHGNWPKVEESLEFAGKIATTISIARRYDGEIVVERSLAIHSVICASPLYHLSSIFSFSFFFLLIFF
jgi:hypothetical protein